MLPPASLSLALALASSAAISLRQQTEVQPTRLPFLFAHSLIFVELGLGDGSTLLALLDTGANASAIDPRRSAQLPALEEVDVQGTTGTLRAEVVEISGARLGASQLPTLRATRRDLSGLLAPDSRPVEMILGSDAFAGRALTLDFPSCALELGPSADESGEEMPIEAGIPAIRARIGALETWLRLDTGASLFPSADVYVNVPPGLWRALREQDPELAPSASLSGTGADGKVVDLPVASLTDARIGPVDLERVFVIVQPEAGYFAEPDAKGFVSNNYLEKLGRVTIDYATRRFRSSPSAAPMR